MNELDAKKLTDSFIQDFICFTPFKLKEIVSYSAVSRFDLTIQTLADLKFLNEFSDRISRYWCVSRACSGALVKLKKNYSVKGSKKIYCNYFQVYGDRRLLRNQHWFEKKRWEFLDELQLVNSETELDEFMSSYQQKLNGYLKIYVSFIRKLIVNLKKVQCIQAIPDSE